MTTAPVLEIWCVNSATAATMAKLAKHGDISRELQRVVRRRDRRIVVKVPAKLTRHSKPAIRAQRVLRVAVRRALLAIGRADIRVTVERL